MEKKFTINERLAKLTPKESAGLRKAIAKMMGRTREHVSRILNAPEGSNKDLPSEVMIRLADYLKCKPEELYNTPPKPLDEEELYDVTKRNT